MVTSLNTSIPARDANDQQIAFKRFDVNFSDAGVSVGVARATLPSGAIIIGTDVLVQSSFNANSTNVFTVGSNSTQYNNLVADGDVTEATVGLVKDISPTIAQPLAADTTFFAKYTQTGGTAATSGKATVIIKYALTESTPS